MSAGAVVRALLRVLGFLMCWVYFLVLGSCKHLNREHDKPSILIPVQIELSFPEICIRSQGTTEASASSASSPLQGAEPAQDTQ